MGESKKKDDHLMKQDASAVDPTKLTALTPDVVRFSVLAWTMILMRMLLLLLRLLLLS